MGMFDSIQVYGTCPYCRQRRLFETHTKDLERALYYYSALHAGWDKMDSWEKAWCNRPVSGCVPYDKTPSVWKNVKERDEVFATVSKPFQKKEFVRVLASCTSDICLAAIRKKYRGRDRQHFLDWGRPFQGKIRLLKGKLIGEMYDIQKNSYGKEKKVKE